MNQDSRRILMPRNYLILLALILSTTLIACSQNKDDKKNPRSADDSNNSSFNMTTTNQSHTLTLLSVEDGKPIANAQVLIGSAVSNPFAQNFLVSDNNGQVFVAEDWTDAQPITIDATGFIRTTFFGQKPEGQIYNLRRIENTGAFQLTGQTSGMKITDRDGLVDFAVVLPALNRFELFGFDINAVISDQLDKIQVLGRDVDIPSNVSLPAQRESYFFPVTLDKPNFRLYFKETGVKQVVALRGQFPLKPVVDEIRNDQDFVALINYFDIQGGSLRDINVRSGGTRQDINVMDMAFNQEKRIQSPVFKDDEACVATFLNLKDNLYYPSDFKNLESGQTQKLKLSTSKDPLLLTFIKKKTETQKKNYVDRASSSMMPLSLATNELLSLIPNPQIRSRNLVRFQPPRTKTNISELATYASLATVTKTVVPLDETQTPLVDTLSIVRTRWELYAPSWIQEAQLPTWPKADPTEDEIDPLVTQQRWSVTFLGQSNKIPNNEKLGPKLFENATHATHSSATF